MKNKLLSGITVIVLAITGSLYFERSQAQSIHVIANPDSGYVIDPGIIYNNKLYFGYGDTSGDYLSQYDGAGITIIPNPSDIGGYEGWTNVYNNKLYFAYYSEIVSLAQYDGTSETIIPYPNSSSGDYGFSGGSFVLNNKLYFLYKLFTGRDWQFAQYDGTNITLIPNPNGTYWGPYYPYAYHDSMYSEIINGLPRFGEYVAKVDGDSLTLFPNPDTGFGVVRAPILYNDKLLFTYQNASRFLQLSSYNGSSLTLIPNTILGNKDSTDAFFCIVYKNKLYLARWDITSRITQLVQFDGTSLTFIPNPDGGTLPSVNSSFIVYNDKLYFQYKNASGAYQLAQFDGTTITLIPNPDNGAGYTAFLDENVSPILYNNKLYINYKNQSKVNQLAQYDGNAIMLIPNPDADLDSNKGYAGFPVIYSDKLFFKYDVNSGLSHLAYLEGSLPITFLHFYAQLKNSDATLHWQTATEENSSHFNIKRSEDGINFYDIGKINAAGSSAAIHTYNYNDPAVVKLGVSKLFYRLEEVDNDGKMQLSNIISIDINEPIRKFIVYPTPANDVININLPSQLSSNAFIVLYNMNGKMVMQQKCAGNSWSQQLNVTNLAQGNYSLTVIDYGKKLVTKQVIIAH